MKLEIKRITLDKDYSISHLTIDGIPFCDTLEDKDRGLNSSMSLEEIKKIKVAGRTAIPTGTYKITLDVVSPKYSNFSRYPWAKEFGGKLPRLLDVPGYEGVLIHVGNDEGDTEGCILVGENRQVGKVLNSTATFKKLYKKLLEDKDNITITITNYL